MPAGEWASKPEMAVVLAVLPKLINSMDFDTVIQRALALADYTGVHYTVLNVKPNGRKCPNAVPLARQAQSSVHLHEGLLVPPETETRRWTLTRPVLRRLRLPFCAVRSSS